MAEDSTEQPVESGQPSSLPMIYILGNSHSGSTLLGFLLAANPRIVNLGELKTRSWLKDRYCSCGHAVAECAFYGEYFPRFNRLKKDVFTKLRDTRPINFFLHKQLPLAAEDLEKVRQFHASVVERVQTVVPEADYVVDTSKSVWLLNAWLNFTPKENIRIIYLKRHPKAILSSFLKRGEPFVRSLIRILVNDRMIRRYLRKNKLDYLEVDFNQFYSDYAAEAEKMSAFLDTEIPSENIEPVHHHAISGNRKTRVSFTNQIPEFRKDDEWERILSPFQKRLLNIIC